MFRIELLPARHGDCIWITYGEPDQLCRILIDGGPAPTWEETLRDRIRDTSELELFVLTHIDADHVAGAIPFLQEERGVTFDDVWFNGWRHLPRTRFLSARQGETFSTVLVDRELPWNRLFDGEAIQVTAGGLPEVTLPGGMRITVLSPTPKQLGRLRRRWADELLRHGLVPGAHHQYRQFLARQPNLSTDVPALAATPFRGDGSVPNAASLAFLAEYGAKTALFTGDATAPVLVRTIKRLLEARGATRLGVDALKVSHHGSRGNTSTALLQLLDCPRYLISSNGAIHNLPDNETIGRIVHCAARPELVFNYDCPRTEVWARRDLQSRYGFRAVFGNDGHVTVDLDP